MALLVGASGCRWAGSQGHWDDATVLSSDDVALLKAQTLRGSAGECGARQLASAATEAERTNPSFAAGEYYEAALVSGRRLMSAEESPESLQLAAQIYQASLKGLIVAGAPISPGTKAQLVVDPLGKARRIGIALHGFAWEAAEFQRVVVVESYQTEALARPHRRCGIGVSVVILRCQRMGEHIEDRFLPARSAFAATAVLRPRSTSESDRATDDADATLDLYNPHVIQAIEFGGRRMALAADLSAPLAYQAIYTDAAVDPIAGFLDPGALNREEGLYFLEPYQPGKIPVVFVHGLLSSPSTWTDMVNDLRANPGFDEHFQIWAFRYSTGRGFLQAAARLRRGLYEAVETVDPLGEDAALRAMVLVGHSMGGLVSTLQVVESREALWNSVASRPIEQIATDEATRRELAESFFFEPQPNVRRVIFLATPHGGSSWASRPVGRIAAKLVRPDDELSARYERLIANNPGVFLPAVERRLPTSIDMLEPTNPLLAAMRRLPLAEGVHAHSIIGTGGALTTIQPGDGVVPVASAVRGQVESVAYVKANHEHVHREAETVGCVRAILARHLAEFAEKLPEVQQAK